MHDGQEPDPLPELELRLPRRPHGAARASRGSRSTPTTPSSAASPTATASRIWNDRGELTLAARFSDRVRPGVVCAPFGWALDASGGVGCNIVTNDATTDFGGGVAFHDNLVQVALP